MLYLNLGLASLTLVAWLVVRVVHRLRPRWLSSVLPGHAVEVLLRLPRPRRGRPGRLGACVGLFLPAATPTSLGGDAQQARPGSCSPRRIVILLTTPLQALGEEYGFRGYLMQAFGSFTHGSPRPRRERVAVDRHRRRAARHLGLFALAHGAQNFPLFFDRFAFGLMAGLVVILVGGLEAGIALHILNNLLAFGVAIAFGELDSALTVSEVSWWQLPVTVVQNGVFLRAGAAGGAQDGAAQHDRATGCPTPRGTSASRLSGRGTGREGHTASIGGRDGRLCIFDPRFARQLSTVDGRADPMGYGVIGSPTGSGPVSLGSSPSTPASTTIWLSRDANARVSSLSAPIRPPLCSGLARRPLKAVARVRIPSGVPLVEQAPALRAGACRRVLARRALLWR